jgi:hypothetical protein
MTEAEQVWSDDDEPEPSALAYSEASKEAGSVLCGRWHRTCQSRGEECQLQHYGIGKKGAPALGASLRVNVCMRALGLSDNGLGSEGVRSLVDALLGGGAPALIILDLSQNQAGPDGAAALGELLAEQTKTECGLQTLRFDANVIGDKGAGQLASGLATNRSLRSLHLCRNEVGCEGAGLMAPALAQNATLETLSLEWNQIRADGCRALISACRDAAVTELDLGWNGVRDEACAAISAALRDGSAPLRELKLHNNHVSAEGGAVLCAALEVLDALELTSQLPCLTPISPLYLPGARCARRERQPARQRGRERAAAGAPRTPRGPAVPAAHGGGLRAPRLQLAPAARQAVRGTDDRDAGEIERDRSREIDRERSIEIDIERDRERSREIEREIEASRIPHTTLRHSVRACPLLPPRCPSAYSRQRPGAPSPPTLDPGPRGGGRARRRCACHVQGGRPGQEVQVGREQVQARQAQEVDGRRRRRRRRRALGRAGGREASAFRRARRERGHGRVQAVHGSSQSQDPLRPCAGLRAPGTFLPQHRRGARSLLGCGHGLSSAASVSARRVGECAGRVKVSLPRSYTATVLTVYCTFIPYCN